MERRKRFLIGLAAALVTFGSLMAFVGPRHYHHSGRFHHGACERDAEPHGFRDGDCYKYRPDNREQKPGEMQDSMQ